MIEINWNPDRKELWFFSLGLAIMLVVLGFLGSDRWHWPADSKYYLMAMSISLIILSTINIYWIKPIYIVWMVAVFPIGWIVSHAILALVYFGVFWPIGLLLRLNGYDPLQLKTTQNQQSFWIKRKRKSSLESYFRQY